MVQLPTMLSNSRSSVVLRSSSNEPRSAGPSCSAHCDAVARSDALVNAHLEGRRTGVWR